MNSQIANCLDEYLLTGIQTTINFDGDGYLDIHHKIMDLLAHVDANDYHGPRLRSMLREIPRAGR
jgi:hypothetical protein